MDRLGHAHMEVREQKAKGTMCKHVCGKMIIGKNELLKVAGHQWSE